MYVLNAKAENYNLQEYILFIHLNNFSYQGVNYRKLVLNYVRLELGEECKFILNVATHNCLLFGLGAKHKAMPRICVSSFLDCHQSLSKASSLSPSPQ